ncbi:hypothetical protein FOA52_005475 [Chlamydomonas sp. UWO 241]|nr:hypothetical protein FOA52_005475 [Chlamydomonas sp. UWO 241]
MHPAATPTLGCSQRRATRASCARSARQPRVAACHPSRSDTTAIAAAAAAAAALESRSAGAGSRRASRRDLLSACGCAAAALAALAGAPAPAVAATTGSSGAATATFSGGDWAFLESAYSDLKARFAADRGQMITIVSAYSPTEAASDEEAGDFYLRVAALADKANDKRDLLIVAGGSQRRAWDSSQLRRPAVRREFNLQLSDRFGLLEAVPSEGADAQAEYDAMAAAIREVATNHLAPRGSRRRRGWQFTLSQRTLRLMDARQRAHTAWLRSKSAAAKRERNRANRAADAAVQRDRERWIGQQVAEAQDMLRKKNLRQFARACDRLAGRSRSHQIPPAMRDVSGALHSGPDGVLKAMTESFDKLYGGETKLSDETLNQLENDVAAFELTRATEVDEAHGRPPDLAETEACVRALRSAAAPGGDQLDAMLLRYDSSRLVYGDLLKTFWRGVDPTQAGGQFDKTGGQYEAVVWVADASQRASAEVTRDKLARSGVFSKTGRPVVVRIDETPDEFEAAPEEETGWRKDRPEVFNDQRRRSGRQAFADSIWGKTQFCKDRVCGYVQFAKECTGECLDVFPEFRDQPGMFAA